MFLACSLCTYICILYFNYYYISLRTGDESRERGKHRRQARTLCVTIWYSNSEYQMSSRRMYKNQTGDEPYTIETGRAGKQYSINSEYNNIIIIILKLLSLYHNSILHMCNCCTVICNSVSIFLIQLHSSTTGLRIWQFSEIEIRLLTADDAPDTTHAPATCRSL